MIAQRYSQDPRTVAEWEPEWLAAASTVMQAENGAEAEVARRRDRRAKMQKGR